ncbi:hypothetical protein [Marinitoga lauensis]|uniref:hypothetical protein n=1 Tax=Marinitoga lauensis TaxID=2201189 RepID=UPI00197DE4C9|nr:hypothetical protein [Marinitoga lauensis]
MQEIIESLGWLNVFFLSFNLSLFVVRRIYRVFIRNKNYRIEKYFIGIIKILQRYHKLSGILLIITGIIHGYIELNGNLYLHTGIILWFGIILMFLVYLLRKIKLFKKAWIKWHRYVGFILIILLLIHLIDPWLL